ncbi:MULTISPECIES: hypothetical protein [Aeromonas]|uniref:hypothetical protein n=1 Tax=Aeromonas TaxID=642 RepID=UPI0022E222D0|nr:MULTISPECIES: hypothetical protein [Aeromonas]WEA32706.1 hypothetical protein PWO56_13435 [Aeromonas hydrophila]
MPNKALNRQQKGAGLGLPMATIGFNMTSPNSEDIYSLIGFTLTYIQVVERSISFVTTYVLQDDDPLTLAKLNSIQAKERKKALGYFIGKVKERATLGKVRASP